MTSALLNAVVCWGGSSKDRDRKRLNKLVWRTSSVLDCLLDSTDVVGERTMLAKLTSIVDNTSHPLHRTVEALSSSFSSRLLQPQCKKITDHSSTQPSDCVNQALTEQSHFTHFLFFCKYVIVLCKHFFSIYFLFSSTCTCCILICCI